MTGSPAGPAERLIRGAAAAAVVAVAGFAAVISYTHIYDLGRAHGGSQLAAQLLPLSVDGLILAMSLVLLHEARARRGAPVLARCMLWLGVAATVAANVAYGARSGPLGAIIWAWPAIAFIGAVEVFMNMVRGGGHPVATAGPVSAEERARTALAESIKAGNPLSARKLARDYDISRPAASRLITELATA